MLKFFREMKIEAAKRIVRIMEIDHNRRLLLQ